ncbi:phage head closure protein [Terribacillus saccharophilus]|uniref:phage head closure protein n=1 Tax=Terribacillus saccharophilus TaxID=361277 RepID=UPI002DC54E7C|nr:phage head closure protein [Terribacillus saccharophilus]MEC0288810.1 phage head closure protein [Terribacillus saccharophilus]
MNPGRLDQRIAFTETGYEEDDDGFGVEKEVEFTKAWAELKTLRDRSFYAAAQTNNEDNLQFLIRYRKDIARRDEQGTRMGLRWRNRDYEIVSLTDDDGKKKIITIVVKAVNASIQSEEEQPDEI